MRRILLALALAVVAVGGASTPTAHAQPAEAAGKPLPDSSMRDGTLMVRVIAGDRSKPVTGADVTLTISSPTGTPPPTTQVARTDAEGRASFADIPEAMSVKLTTPGPDNEVVASSSFPMPQTGGIRVLLSTITMAGAAPAAGGPMMTPRKMSGQPRPEPADARDAITVRVSYDDFADASPLDGIPIALVGYRYDQQVSGSIVPTDAAGRAVFSGLDARGTTTYFAMTQLHRNGHPDRLISQPILLDGESGVRVMLSSDKRGATTPPIDDFSQLDPQPTRGSIPPGMVRAILSGAPETGAPVWLLDAVSGQRLQTVMAGPPLLDYDTRGGAFEADVVVPTMAPGTLALTITAGNQPARGVGVWVRPVGSTERQAAPAGLTDAAGAVTLTSLPVGVALEIVVSVDGDAIVRETRTLPARGGVQMKGSLKWSTGGEGGALFTNVPGGPDRAYVVATTMRGQPYVSAPFQLTAERGVATIVRVMPRVMFSFSLTSWIDDVYMGVRGQFTIRNMSWAPYVASRDGRPDEVVMPMPLGFTGAVVRDDFQQIVGVDPSRGFVIRRPIPPGGYQFIAGFSMKVGDDGRVRWEMPLPLGSFDSGIEIKRDGTAMHLDLPSVKGRDRFAVREADDERGRFYVLSPITILPNQSMVFTVSDLPRAPTWKRYAKVFVGLMVLSVLALTAFFSLWRPRSRSLPQARFDTLLDELAALEVSGQDPARQKQLMSELEALYRHDGPPR